MAMYFRTLLVAVVTVFLMSTTSASNNSTIDGWRLSERTIGLKSVTNSAIPTTGAQTGVVSTVGTKAPVANDCTVFNGISIKNNVMSSKFPFLASMSSEEQQAYMKGYFDMLNSRNLPLPMGMTQTGFSGNIMPMSAPVGMPIAPTEVQSDAPITPIPIASSQPNPNVQVLNINLPIDTTPHTTAANSTVGHKTNTAQLSIVRDDNSPDYNGKIHSSSNSNPNPTIRSDSPHAVHDLIDFLSGNSTGAVYTSKEPVHEVRDLLNDLGSNSTNSTRLKPGPKSGGKPPTKASRSGKDYKPGSNIGSGASSTKSPPSILGGGSGSSSYTPESAGFGGF